MTACHAPISFSLFKTGLGFVFARCLARQDEASQVETPLPLKLSDSTQSGKTETGAVLMANMAVKGARPRLLAGAFDTYRAASGVNSSAAELAVRLGGLNQSI
jgi:hypothetical protein